MEVLYICDRKKCGEKCGAHCNHTRDIQHAANFKESEFLPGMMIEVANEVTKKEPPKGCQKIEIETVPIPTKTENDVDPWVLIPLAVILFAITVAVVVAAKLV